MSAPIEGGDGDPEETARVIFFTSGVERALGRSTGGRDVECTD
jgi:hypothetical protein